LSGVSGDYKSGNWGNHLKGENMSDNPSLYIRVKLSQIAFEKYLDSNTAVANDFNDWVSWFNEKTWCSSPPDQTDVDSWSKKEYRQQIVKDNIEKWCANNEHLVKSSYNVDTNTWQFGCVDFSYNADTNLVSLPLLRNICKFKDTQDQDYLVIYDYLNNPSHRFGIFTIEKEKSRLCHKIPEDFMTEATDFLTSLMKDAGLWR
jgi:hypothetical protein